MPPENVE